MTQSSRVIRERQPLKVYPTTIKDIAVPETIKAGHSLDRRAAGAGLPLVHLRPDHGHAHAPTPDSLR